MLKTTPLTRTAVAAWREAMVTRTRTLTPRTVVTTAATAAPGRASRVADVLPGRPTQAAFPPALCPLTARPSRRYLPEQRERRPARPLPGPQGPLTERGTAVIHTTRGYLFWDSASGKWVEAASLRTGDPLHTPDDTTAHADGGSTPASHEAWGVGPHRQRRRRPRLLHRYE
jgi:hypothetical protein